MFDRLSPVIRTATLVIASLFASVSSSLAAQNSNVIVVIDSSRSMWGQIDEVNKVVIVRNVLGNMFKQFDGRVNMGLISYGHRKESGCTDIELIRPLGALVAKDYSAIVNKIKPKGSTPIARSLKLAAQSSGPVAEASSILLISDGLDNCSGDPCAMAATLKQQHPLMKIHVVAFDRHSKEELASLQCISQATGGTFSATTNQEQLQRAVDNAMDSSMTGATAALGTLAPVSPQMVPQQIAQIQPIEQTQQAAPQLSAQEIIVIPPAPALSSSWQPVTNLEGGTEIPQPKNGQSAFGKVAAAIEHSNVDGKSAMGQMPTSLAPVTLTALLHEGGRQIDSGIIWRIFDSHPDKSGKYRLVSTHRDSSPTAALAPGEYLVNAAYGRAHLTRKIKVAVGKGVNEQFIMNSGGLRLGAVLANGEPIPANNVNYTIFSDERDQFGKREKIMSEAKPGLIIRLNAGIYHIVSKYGDANAVVKADVTVEPGKLTEATINHRAARVTLKLVFHPGGEALANTQWSVLTQAGDLVKSSAGALPTHILAAGNYSVSARHSGQEYKMQFAVQAGDVKQVEVVVQ